MVQPVEHDVGSAAGTTVLGAAKGMLGYGLVGTALSTAIGAAVGALAVAVGSGLIGFLANAAVQTVDFLISFVDIPDVNGAVSTGLSNAGTGLGAFVGGLGGFVYGGATSLAGGAIAGAFQGKNQVDREQSLAKSIQFEKSRGQEQMLAAVRGDAAEQYSAMGYMQGIQDAQAAIMNQIAAQQQPKYDNPESKVAKRIIHEHHAKHGEHAASHAEKAIQSKADTGHAQVV